jgi:hypothetical protein
MRRLATILWYMIKRQQPYKLSAANDPAAACATVPPDVNAFFKASQGRSKEEKKKAAATRKAPAAKASLTRP